MSIYLDHAAMTPPLPCALEAYQNAPFGNPSSEHEAGERARDALEHAREAIAKWMLCDTSEIYFTSTATEAAALALHSLAEAGYKIIQSGVEHHAISENVKKANWRTVAFARMHTQNETGEILPVLNISSPDLLLCDATAAVGHLPAYMTGFSNLGCDYLIADAIKFGGVPGAAFLIVKKGSPLSPLIRGGGQERGMRSGTENVPAICAMAAALEWQMQHMDENTQKIAAMRQILVQSLSRIENHKWNTPFESPCVPHILNISFDGVDARALSMLLSKEGVMVSPGAACSNGLNESSHVIMAMYHDEARARSALRISLSHTNTPDECVEAAEKIKNAVAYLRSLS